MMQGEWMAGRGGSLACLADALGGLLAANCTPVTGRWELAGHSGYYTASRLEAAPWT